MVVVFVVIGVTMADQERDALLVQYVARSSQSHSCCCCFCVHCTNGIAAVVDRIIALTFRFAVLLLDDVVTFLESRHSAYYTASTVTTCRNCCLTMSR